MKKILVLMVFLMVFVSGCSSQDFHWPTFAEGLNTYALQQQNLARQQQMQANTNAAMINQQLRQNARHRQRMWQLQNSEQEQYYRRKNWEEATRPRNPFLGVR